MFALDVECCYYWKQRSASGPLGVFDAGFGWFFSLVVWFSARIFGIERR